VILAALLGGALGCGTTRVTNTQRTATEQLLVSNAIDQSVSQLDFRMLAGKPVYFDAQYLGGSIDQGYVVSSLRQHLLACGCVLTEDRTQATYVVEARSGGIGTDLHQVLFGVPQMNVPSLVPGQPSLIPEIPFAKKTDQKGVAKIAVFAYNRRTGRPIWQSGIVQSQSTSKDTWVLGAGPFRRGTVGEATEFVGQQISIPLLSGKESGKEENAPVIAVTRPAVWDELPEPPLSPYHLTSESRVSELPKQLSPAAPSVELTGAGNSEKSAGTAADKNGGPSATAAFLDLILSPGNKSEGAADSGRNNAGTGAGSGRDSTLRKSTSSPTTGTERAK
jgi:hypothetical protein